MPFGKEIRRLREEAGISAQKLADIIGINADRLRKWEQKDNNPRITDKAIIENFFGMDLSKVMELKSIKDFIIVPNNSIQPNAKPIGIPIGTYKRNGNEYIELSNGQYKLKTKLVMQKAHLGYLTGWGDDEYIEALPEHDIIVDQPVTGTFITFEAEGDSMDDGSKESIEHRDLVTGRKIPRSNWNNKLAFKKHKDFIIVCKPNAQHDGGIIVKRIIDHNTTENYILCHSLNPDKETYPDFIIHMIDVMQIFHIVQITKVRKVR